jgi:hypothetical protein
MMGDRAQPNCAPDENYRKEYDTWKIKAIAAQGTEGRKPAILGALTLYLDFINLECC